MKLINFIKSHDVQAKVLENGNIQVKNEWYKPSTGESGIELIELKPTLNNVRNFLGY